MTRLHSCFFHDHIFYYCCRCCSFRADQGTPSRVDQRTLCSHSSCSGELPSVQPLMFSFVRAPLAPLVHCWWRWRVAERMEVLISKNLSIHMTPSQRHTPSTTSFPRQRIGSDDHGTINDGPIPFKGKKRKKKKRIRSDALQIMESSDASLIWCSCSSKAHVTCHFIF